MKQITVKNHKEFTETVREYRNKGFNIITFWKDFAEMEKGNELVVIDRR